jgi:hypothetical protein
MAFTAGSPVLAGMGRCDSCGAAINGTADELHVGRHLDSAMPFKEMWVPC